MTSLAYNIGPGAFAKSSALRKFNAGDKAGAANAILLCNKAGGKVLGGLVRRREAERALFLSPVGKAQGVTLSPPLAKASNTPAQREVVPPVSSAKEAAKTVAGGATGAGLVVAALAFGHAAWEKFAAFADWVTFWN